MKQGPLIATLVMLVTAQLQAQARTLTTLFAADSTCADGGVVMFQAIALNAPGIRITGLAVNCSGGANLPVTVNVYTTPGNYLGVERNAAAWTLVASGSAGTGPIDTPTTVELPDFALAQGSWGIAVQTTGAAQACTNGAPGNQVHFDAHLLLLHGATLSTQFQAGGQLVPAQVWNGSFHYAAPGDAVFGPFGPACGPVWLAPAAQSQPSVGQALTLIVTAGNGSAGGVTGTFGRGGPPPWTGPTCLALMVTGFSKTSGAGQTLPFDLTALGMTGCSLLVEPLAPVVLQVMAGLGSISLSIPNDPQLYWVPLYSQAFVLLSAVNPLGVAATNGCEGVIGR